MLQGFFYLKKVPEKWILKYLENNNQYINQMYICIHIIWWHKMWFKIETEYNWVCLFLQYK